jgi:hypothetical protein
MRGVTIIGHVAAVLGVFGAACVSESKPLDPTAGASGEGGAAGASGGSATDTAAGSSGPAVGAAGIAGEPAVDGGASSADGASSYSVDQCRWEGYGIGPLGAGQCNTQHLMAHSWMECSVGGGVGNMQRDIVDQCTADQADEVQTLCCFQSGVPPAAQTAVGTLYGAVELVTIDDAPANRGAFLAAAVAKCGQQGLDLGDWSMLYAYDGTTPEVLRVGCH